MTVVYVVRPTYQYQNVKKTAGVSLQEFWHMAEDRHIMYSKELNLTLGICVISNLWIREGQCDSITQQH